MGFYKQNIFFSSLALHKKWKPALLLFPGCSQQAPLSPATREMSSLFSFNGSLLISTVSWQKTEQKVLLSKALQKERSFHLKSSSSSRSLPCRAEHAQGSGGLSLWGKRVIKDTQVCVGAITGWGDGGSYHQAKNNWGWLSVWSCFKSVLTPTSKTPGRKWKVKTRLHSLDAFPTWLLHLTSAVFRKRISRFIVTDCLSSRASNTPWRYESASMWLLFFWAW